MATLEQVGYQATIQGLNSFLSGTRQIDSSMKGLSATSVALGNLAAQAVMKITSAMTDFARSTVGTAADFESQMALMNIAARDAGASFDELRQYAIEMGAQTFESAQGAAEGMTNLFKAGLDAQQVFAAFPNIANLAAASELSLAQASDAVVVSMRTFGLTASDSADIVDNFVKSADASVTEVDELVAAIANVGPVAASFGMSLEDTNTALALLSERGIRGAEAGTALRSMLLNINRDTDDVTGMLDRLGVSLYDLQGNARPLKFIFGDLNAAMQGMTDEQRNLIAQTLAGSYGIKAFNTLLGDQVDQIDLLDSELTAYGNNQTWGNVTVAWDEMSIAIEGAASASEIAAARFDTFQGRLEQFRGGLETLAIQIGTPIINALSGVLDFFNNKVIPTLTNIFSGKMSLTEALKKFFSVDISALVAAVRPLIDFISQVAAFIQQAIGLIFGGLTRSPKRGSSVTGGVAATFGSGIEMRQMGGTVVAGQAYLVGEEGAELFIPAKSGEIVDAKKTKETLGAGFKGGKQAAQTAGVAASSAISGAATSIGASAGRVVGEAASASIDAAVEAVTDAVGGGRGGGGGGGGLDDLFADAMDGAADAAEAGMGGIGETMGGIFDGAMAALTGKDVSEAVDVTFGDLVEDFFGIDSETVDRILGNIGDVLGNIGDVISGAFNNIKTAIEGIDPERLDEIAIGIGAIVLALNATTILSGGLAFLGLTFALGGVTAAAGDVLNFLGDIGDIIKSLAEGDIKGAIDGAISALGNLGSAIGNFFIGGVQSLFDLFGIDVDVRENLANLGDSFGALVGAIGDWFGEIGTSIKEAFEDAVSGMLALWTNLWNDIKNLPVIGEIVTVVEAIIGALPPIIEGILNIIKDLWDKIWNGMGQVVRDIIGATLDVMAAAVDALGGTLGGLGRILNALGVSTIDFNEIQANLSATLRATADVVRAGGMVSQEDIFAGVWEGQMPTVAAPTTPSAGDESVPWFMRGLFFRAHGGPVLAGQTYMVGEQGPELFRPTMSGMIIPGSRMGDSAYNSTDNSRGDLVLNFYGPTNENDVIGAVNRARVQYGW